MNTHNTTLSVYDTQKAVGDIGEYVFECKAHQKSLKILHRPSSEDNFPYYDFLIQKDDKAPIRIEVKTDQFDTENFAIEIKQKGHPSGLEVTQAEYYFIYRKTSKEMYFMGVDEIKRYIEDNNLAPMLFENGNTGYLLPISVFTPYN